MKFTGIVIVVLAITASQTLAVPDPSPGFLSNVFTAVTNTATTLTSNVLKVANTTVQSGLNVVGNVVNTVTNVTATVLPITSNLINSTTQAVIGGTSSIVSGVVGLTNSTINTVVNGSQVIVGGVSNAINSTITNLSNGTTVGTVIDGIANATQSVIDTTVSLTSVPDVSQLTNFTQGLQLLVQNLTDGLGLFNETFEATKALIQQAGTNFTSSLNANSSSECEQAANNGSASFIKLATEKATQCFQTEINNAVNDLTSVNSLLSLAQNFLSSGRITLSFIGDSISATANIATDVSSFEARAQICSSSSIAEALFGSTQILSEVAQICNPSSNSTTTA